MNCHSKQLWTILVARKCGNQLVHTPERNTRQFDKSQRNNEYNAHEYRKTCITMISIYTHTTTTIGIAILEASVLSLWQRTININFLVKSDHFYLPKSVRTDNFSSKIGPACPEHLFCDRSLVWSNPYPAFPTQCPIGLTIDRCIITMITDRKYIQAKRKISICTPIMYTEREF